MLLFKLAIIIFHGGLIFFSFKGKWWAYAGITLLALTALPKAIAARLDNLTALFVDIPGSIAIVVLGFYIYYKYFYKRRKRKK